MSGLIGATIKIEGTPGLARLRKRLTDPKAALQVAGRAGRNTMVRHLRAYNRAHPNKLGGKRTNFYALAAAATSFQFLENSGRGGAVEVSSSAIGLALRYHGTGGLPGGVLRPLSGKYLTMPAAPEAHGKRAREFDDLDFGFAWDVRLGRMRPALVRKNGGLAPAGRRRKGAGEARPVALPFGPGTRANTGDPIFWLLRSSRMVGDPTVLPAEEQIADEARAAVAEYLDVLDERGSA